MSKKTATVRPPEGVEAPPAPGRLQGHYVYLEGLPREFFGADRYPTPEAAVAGYRERLHLRRPDLRPLATAVHADA